MKKDSIERQMEEVNTIQFSFEEVSSSIHYEKYEKPKKKVSRLKIGLPIAFLTAIAIMITCFIYFNSLPKIEGIIIANQDDLVIEYEKNAKFIDSGIDIEKKISNGKKEKAQMDEVVIDSNEFVNGKVGTYRISIYMKKNQKVQTGFDVQVVDDEIKEIQLEDYRNEYYVGEKVIPQDITIQKICTSGAIKEAKITEYTIDDSEYDSTKVGTYPVRVILKSNEDFHLTYNVDVKPLDDVDLNGRYAYIDDYMEIGHPMIYAFDIMDDVIYSRYSEIIMKGTMNREIIDGNIIIRTTGYTQNMVYNPETRTLLVSGIAGDPDMPCFRLNRTDYLIGIEGVNIVDKDTKYIAKDGCLSSSTLDYLNYMYGGTYRNSSMKEEVTSQTVFESDAMVYVGVKPIVDDKKPYVGVWYNKHGKVVIHIEANAIYTNPKYSSTYTVQNKGNNTYWIRSNDYGIFSYNKDTDTLDILVPENQSVYETLNRYNEITDAIVTLNMSYNTTIEYVLLKGSSLTTVFYTENNISWYGIESYHGEEIYEDTIFYTVSSYSYGFSDILGMYGTAKDHVRVLGHWSADRFTSGHPYWYQVIENYEVVKMGWLIWTNLDLNENKKTFTVHYEDGSTEEISTANSSLWIGEQVVSCNKNPFAGFEMLGEYQNADGKLYTLADTGILSWTETNSANYTYNCSAYIYLTNEEENKISGYYLEQDSRDNRIVHEICFEKNGTKWSFIKDGITYISTFES